MFLKIIRTTEGKAWAARLINDCYYHLARASIYHEKYIEAKKYMQRYLECLANGVNSIHDKKSVDKLIQKLDKYMTDEEAK